MHIASLVLAFAAVGASLAKPAPLHLANRDAVSPPITNPTAQTVWRVGETQMVTWDVAALNGAPPSNPLAKIILGTLTPDGEEHLMFDTPLVSGFPILGGNVSLTVPPVPSGSNYIVCLFGSSGDISPAFSIVGSDTSFSSSPSSPSSTSTAPASPSTSAPASQVDAASTSPTATAPAPAAPSTTSADPSATGLMSAAESPASMSVSSSASSSGGSSSGSATVISTSPSSSASVTGAGTSGAQRGAVTHAHLWSIPCALLFALAFL
ncbi:hypothetical protein OH77DRAFT_1494814 [Trametes cingulata]|nr:hypothetical protein OH77DRAFT_1494814 [Trametes cingulata]